MDFDSSSKFIASLARFLQSLCNGYVEFDKGVEVIGHIYLSVDSDTGRKIDYVLNEKVCKNDNSVTFISNSFHAQPAEKPQPVPKKPETDNRNEDSGVIDESGQSVPNNVNIRTTDSSRDSPLSSNKRPRSPLQCRMGIGRGSLGPVAKSPRYQDQTGTQVKFSHHTDVSTNNVMNSSEDYDGSYGEDEDSFLNQDYSNLEIDQKPVIEPDVSIVKEEYMASQQGGASYSNSQPTGPGRGRPPSSSQASFPTHHNSTFTSSNYSASSLMSHDPPKLTQAQQEELEMYYRKGTDQHLTFLRNMREAHAMYPFTGKRDKELFDKALEELYARMPVLNLDAGRALVHFLHHRNSRANKRRAHRNKRRQCQFKSPGQGMGGRGGKAFGRQPSYPGAQNYPYSPGFSGRPIGNRNSEGEAYFGDDDSYAYQQGASDDSRDTQHSGGDMSQHQMGFVSTDYGDGSQQGYDPTGESSGVAGGSSSGQDSGCAGGGKSPPDIKYEVTPVPFIKADDFELIEIDPDEDDDL